MIRIFIGSKHYTPKFIGRLTDDSLLDASARYSKFKSVPTPLLPNLCATDSVVPDPTNGSSTVAGTISALHSQVGCQPRRMIVDVRFGMKPS